MAEALALGTKDALIYHAGVIAAAWARRAGGAA